MEEIKTAYLYDNVLEKRFYLLVLELFALEEPSDSGWWFAKDLDVQGNWQTSLQCQRVEVGAVDTWFHCNK